MEDLKSLGAACEWNPEKKEFIVYNDVDSIYQIKQLLIKENIYFQTTFDSASRRMMLHINENEKEKIRHLAFTYSASSFDTSTKNIIRLKYMFWGLDYPVFTKNNLQDQSANKQNLNSIKRRGSK